MRGVIPPMSSVLHASGRSYINCTRNPVAVDVAANGDLKVLSKNASKMAVQETTDWPDTAPAPETPAQPGAPEVKP